MRKNIEISYEKINEFLEQFYSYFESGYAFEEFLKVYLEKIGLDEVVEMHIHFQDRKSTRLNSSHLDGSRMPSSA